MTGWKDAARQRGLQPVQVWRHAIPDMKVARPSEMAVLWDSDDSFRSWLTGEMDRLSGRDEVPM